MNSVFRIDYVADGQEISLRWPPQRVAENAIPEATEINLYLRGDLQNLANIKFPTNIHSLKFREADVDSNVSEIVARFPNVHKLSFVNCQISERTLNSLSHNLLVEQLKMSNCRINARLDVLAGFSHLIDLLFSGTWNGELTQSISPIPTMKQLYIEGQSIEPFLEIMPYLINLQELSLENWRFSGKNASFLSSLKRLKTLNLDWSSLTSPVLDTLCTLSQLEKLSLFEISLDDSIVERVISKLVLLQAINLHGTWISDAPLSLLRELEHLEELILSRTHVTNSGVQLLAKCFSLRYLALEETQVDANAFPHLAALSLQTLRLERVDISPRQSDLRILSNLRRLDLRSAVLEDGQLILPAAIEELDLSGSEINDQTLESLKYLSRLRVLNLSGTTISGSCLQYLYNSFSLECLEVSETEIADSALALLGQLDNLSILDLSNSKIVNAHVLEKFPHLRTLHLENTPLSQETLNALTYMPQLQTLYLIGVEVEDRIFAFLSGLANLQNLYMDKTSINGSGLKHIINSPRLNTLSIMNTNVSSQSVSDLLAIPNLIRLRCSNQNFSESDINTLSKQIFEVI